MAQPASDNRIARFGVFDLDPRTGELRKRGVRVRLQEQPFQILTLLLERAGDLVTRDELRQRLWSEDVFVDVEQGLNNAVAKIRAALGDSAQSPRFVETLERRGYRFVGTVEWSDVPANPAADNRSPAAYVKVTGSGRTVALAEGTHLIGRDPAAAVWIDSAVVSRRHALLTVSGERVTIEDLRSRNGTFVNGARVRAAAVLAEGDAVRLGTVPLTVSVSIGTTATLEPGDSNTR
jgi:DNA-binding winged helix-turn-helix (wHTH) protein